MISVLVKVVGIILEIVVISVVVVLVGIMIRPTVVVNFTVVEVVLPFNVILEVMQSLL